MRTKSSVFLSFLLFCICSYSQQNLQWQGYFSYRNVKDIATSSTAFYAATENTIFTKNIISNNLTTFNSVDGFKIEDISAIYRSEINNITLVGSANGLLLLIKQDGTIIPKRGIIDEVPVSPFIKKVNSFFEFKNKVYISCDYGISVFDLNTQEFGDTYYIGNSGQPVKVYQTIVYNNELFAVTDVNGIKKAAVSNPNLVDFNQWLLFDAGYWNGIATINNQLVATNTNSITYKYDGTNFQPLLNMSQQAVDIRENENHLIITTQNHVYIYNNNLFQIAHFQSSQITNVSVSFTCATIIENNIYIGTSEEGVLSVPISNLSGYQFIMPNGPLENNIFRLKKSPSTLWAVYGTYNRTYNPYVPGLFLKPISHYTSEKGWDFIPSTDIFGARALSNIVVNPNNQNEVYISSFFSGLLKISNGLPTQLYNQTNSGSNGLSISPIANDIRLNGPCYDKSGNLWMTSSFNVKGLNVFRTNGTWQSYDVSNTVSRAFEASYGLLVVDKNNTKWVPTLNNGILVFNDTMANKAITINAETSGNLPSKDVRCLAIDNRNQLWIGTQRGLRIISNVDQFLTQDEIQTTNIVIEEDGLAQELFYDQFIIDIAVDGANRKWVSLANAGVYLVSSNGQETIYKFTKDNSPLPSNTINDIEIDGVSGEVFFATDKGLVSFKGISTKPQSDLNSVYVYPNPVRPEYSGTIKISRLTDKAIIKITDIEGNLVYETTSSGGTIEWDGTAFGKYKVASGVYMIFVSGQDGIETAVKKVMIIR